MSEEADNLKLWDRVCRTDPKFTKQVSIGRKFTAICAQYQMHNATTVWGPYGGAWGLKNLRWSIERDETGKPVLYALDAVFFYPGGQFEIRVDDQFDPKKEIAKGLLTEARSKSLSLLGFNADVFMGAFDGNRYIDPTAVTLPPAAPAPEPPKPVETPAAPAPEPPKPVETPALPGVPSTKEQRDLAAALAESHVWTPEERAVILAQITEMTKVEATSFIDRMKAELERRKGLEKEQEAEAQAQVPAWLKALRDRDCTDEVIGRALASWGWLDAGQKLTLLVPEHAALIEGKPDAAAKAVKEVL